MISVLPNVHTLCICTSIQVLLNSSTNSFFICGWWHNWRMQDIKGSLGAQISCLNEATRAISNALEHISPGHQLLVPGVFVCASCQCVSYPVHLKQLWMHLRRQPNRALFVIKSCHFCILKWSSRVKWCGNLRFLRNCICLHFVLSSRKWKSQWWWQTWTLARRAYQLLPWLTPAAQQPRLRACGTCCTQIIWLRNALHLPFASRDRQKTNISPPKYGACYSLVAWQSTWL